MSNVTETPVVKTRKPRTPKPEGADMAKLQARIAKLQAALAGAQEKLAVEANPEVAGKVKAFKAAKARLTANKRFLTMKAKKLRRLEGEVVDYREQVADYTKRVTDAQARVDLLQPEIDALKITVEPDEGDDTGDDSEE